MYRFLVWHVLIVSISCELFKEESGYIAAYAPQYHNYKPKDYHFNYAVSDPHTGDHKSQWETKTNGVVRGGYSLLEPDGTTRLVEYIADDDGFRAVVNKIGDGIYPQEVPVEVVPGVPLLHKSYNGQITNYAPSSQYYVDQNLRTVAPVSQFHTGGTIGVVPENYNNVIIQQQRPIEVQNYHNGHIQEDNLEVVPLPEYSVESSEVQGHHSERADLDQISGLNEGRQEIAHQGRNLEWSKVVPSIQGQNIGAIQAVPTVQAENVGFGNNFGRADLQGYSVPRGEVVPFVQGPNSRYIQSVPHVQLQNVGNVGHDVSRVELQRHNVARSEAVPLSQGHNLVYAEAVPNQERRVLDNRGYNFEPVELQGHNAVESQGVPLFQGHNLKNVQAALNVELQNYGNIAHDVGRVELQGHDALRSEQVPPSQGYNLVNAQAVPNQERQIFENVNHNLRQPTFQVHNVNPQKVVPFSQNHNFDNFRLVPNQERQIFENVGNNFGRAEIQQHTTASPEVVPYFQGHNEAVSAAPGLRNEHLGNIYGSVPRAESQGFSQGHNFEQTSIDGANFVPISQIGGEVHSQGQVPAVPEAVSLRSSYGTAIDFQGQDYDNRLRKDIHHSSASQRALKAVPAPHDKQKQQKKDFLIYYPEFQ